jgi:hypothetical protein
MDDCIIIDQEIDAVARVVDDGRVDKSIAKRKCLLFILIVALIGGFFYAFGPVESENVYEEAARSDYLRPIEFASSLLITFGVLAWCLFDAEERKIKFSRKSSIWFVFFPFICFPWYVLKSRRGMACFKIFMGTALFIVLYIAACGLGYVLGCLGSYVF